MVAALGGAALRDTVPWRFRGDGTQSLWSWQTEAFLAVIVLSGGKWMWEVSVNNTVVLASGECQGFDDGEMSVLETIGKAFPPHAGFAHLTDHAAAHYTFADGKRYDLTDFDGRLVIVTITTGQQVRGVLGIRDWWLHLTAGERTVDIHPLHVVKIDTTF